MVWLLVALTTILADFIPLMPGEPVVNKVGAGETLQFQAVVPEGKRATITLVPLNGDADLIVSLISEVPTGKATFKSANPALQIEWVSIPKHKKQIEVKISVLGITETQFVLFLGFTERSVAIEPRQTSLMEIQWQEVAFADDTFLGALTIANKTATWYEVTIKPLGFEKGKANFPSSFVLGPKGKRYLGWIALTPKSKIMVTFQRTSKADAFLVADCVSRLVAGVSISPEVDIAIDDLMPNLRPLLSVAHALREGDWKRASVSLVTILRSNPQTLTALHTFLQRVGVRLPRDVLGNRIASGFGAISAAISVMAVIKLPTQEQVTVTVK